MSDIVKLDRMYENVPLDNWSYATRSQFITSIIITLIILTQLV